MIDTEKYKHELEAHLAQVTAELTTLGVQEPETGDWVATPETIVGEADPNDAADMVEDWNERRATLSQLETRFNNIKRALGKIADGAYGVCEIGNEPIETDRLDANPAARTCKAHLEQEDQLSL